MFEESVEDGRVCRHLAVLAVDGEAGVSGGRGKVPELGGHHRPVVSKLEVGDQLAVHPVLGDGGAVHLQLQSE